jgi:hypothetical protein
MDRNSLVCVWVNQAAERCRKKSHRLLRHKNAVGNQAFRLKILRDYWCSAKNDPRCDNPPISADNAEATQSTGTKH